MSKITNPKDWSCEKCGEFYPKGGNKKFVNYCCKEQAWSGLENSLGRLKDGLQDYSSLQDLDKFLSENGIKPTEDN